MQVEKDIQSAINIMDLKRVNKGEYRPIMLFPKHSLKSFKKYKLENKNALTKLNSHAEVLDLLSYGANVSCYSTNRLDEYFLYLQLQLLNLKYKEYISYILDKNIGFSKELYDKIKNGLDDKTRYFFDEIYKYVQFGNIFESKLCDTKNIKYEDIVKFIRYLLEPKYYKTKENTKPNFILCKDCSIPLYFDDNSFNFINLSYNIDSMNISDIKYFKRKIINNFSSLLKEYGKIQCFYSKSGLDIEELKKMEFRSIDDPNSSKDVMKKDYIYTWGYNE